MSDDAPAQQGPPRWPGDRRGPWLPGNTVAHTAALTHGARSARELQPVAAVLAAELVASARWTASEAFATTVASWAYSEAQLLRLRGYLDEHGLLDDDGEERPAARLLDRVEGRLAKLRDQLGLTPAALGKLLATAASVAGATGDAESLTSLQAEGRRILASRLTTPDDTPAQADEEAPTDG